jgi:alkaline phosphatase D
VWNVLGSSVMLSPMNLVTLREDERTVPVAEFLSEHRVGASSGSSTGSSADVVRGGGVSLNPDQWDGYGAEQRRLVELLASSASKTLVLTGDIHTEWAHALSHEGREFGCELVTSSVSAPNVDEILGLPRGNALSQVAQEYLAAANPRLRHVELDSHGYAIARVSRDRVRMEFLRTPDVGVSGAAVAVAHEMVWQEGMGFVGEVAASSGLSSGSSLESDA